VAVRPASQPIFLDGIDPGKILMEVKACPLFIVTSDEKLGAAAEPWPVKLP